VKRAAAVAGVWRVSITSRPVAGCPTCFRDQAPDHHTGSTHRHLSAAPGAVGLRKRRECGSGVPGCWRRTCSGSNGSKRGINRPKLNRLRALAVDFGTRANLQSSGRGQREPQHARICSRSGDGANVTQLAGARA
jgi:hypothetical protein